MTFLESTYKQGLLRVFAAVSGIAAKDMTRAERQIVSHVAEALNMTVHVDSVTDKVTLVQTAAKW